MAPLLQEEYQYSIFQCIIKYIYYISSFYVNVKKNIDLLSEIWYNKSSLFIIETNRQVMFGGFIPPNKFKEVLQ